MKYYVVRAASDAETGEGSVVDFMEQPRKIVSLHVYLLCYESDLIQAGPAFLATKKLRSAMEASGITGADFLPCKVSKDPQFDDYSKTGELPEIFGLEPVGSEGLDDLVFHDETKFMASDRFVRLLRSMAHDGCEIEEC